MLKTSLAALALGAALAAAGTAGAADKPKFVYLTQTGIDNSFWQSIKRGMDDACAQFEADCQLIFTTPNGDLQKHLQNLETVVEQGVDGIVTVIVNDDLYDETVKKAVDKGIPVITANVDDSQGAAGNARNAFVGQDLFEAGYVLMKGLHAKIPADQPIHALLGLSRPGESWAEARIGGAKKFLEEAKAAEPNREITYEVIDSSNDISVTHAERGCGVEHGQGFGQLTARVRHGVQQLPDLDHDRLAARQRPPQIQQSFGRQLVEQRRDVARVAVGVLPDPVGRRLLDRTEADRPGQRGDVGAAQPGQPDAQRAGPIEHRPLHADRRRLPGHNGVGRAAVAGHEHDGQGAQPAHEEAERVR